MESSQSNSQEIQSKSLTDKIKQFFSSCSIQGLATEMVEKIKGFFPSVAGFKMNCPRCRKECHAVKPEGPQSLLELNRTKRSYSRFARVQECDPTKEDESAHQLHAEDPTGVGLSCPSCSFPCHVIFDSEISHRRSLSTANVRQEEINPLERVKRFLFPIVNKLKCRHCGKNCHTLIPSSKPVTMMTYLVSKFSTNSEEQREGKGEKAQGIHSLGLSCPFCQKPCHSVYNQARPKKTDQ